MLNKNFYELVHSALKSENVSIKKADGTTGSATVKELFTTGTYCKPPFAAMATYLKNYHGPQFGAGRTKATVDDFALEEPLNDKIQVVLPSNITINKSALYEEYSATYGVTARENVTIGEVGLYACYGRATPAHPYMVDRTVLENPITLTVGESVQFTYTIRFNYPVSA